jgi:hypothetical protein
MADNYDNLTYDPSNTGRAPHTAATEVGATPEPKIAPIMNDWTKKPSRWNGVDTTSKRPTK